MECDIGSPFLPCFSKPTLSLANIVIVSSEEPSLKLKFAAVRDGSISLKYDSLLIEAEPSDSALLGTTLREPACVACVDRGVLVMGRHPDPS